MPARRGLQRCTHRSTSLAATLTGLPARHCVCPVLGGKGSEMFDRFVNASCTAYNALRGKADLLITLFSLMLSTGIP